jgi:hypothetical protein
MFLHSIRTLRTSVQNPVPATCPAHFTSLDLIIQTKSGAGTNPITFVPSLSCHLRRLKYKFPPQNPFTNTSKPIWNVNLKTELQRPCYAASPLCLRVTSLHAFGQSLLCSMSSLLAGHESTHFWPVPVNFHQIAYAIYFFFSSEVFCCWCSHYCLMSTL